MRLRIALLAVLWVLDEISEIYQSSAQDSYDEVRELRRVANEEDGRVVVHEIEISLFCTKLDRKAARVAKSVRRTCLASDSRETDCRTGLGPDLCKQLRTTQISDIVRGLEVPVRARSLCVNLCREAVGQRSVERKAASWRRCTYNTLRNTLTVEVREEINVVEV